ncbi:MAG: nucleotidyltransferase family protein [Pseudodesulfovibrio sp.]
MKQEIANVSGVLLAAGGSTRMGGDKRFLPFRGLPLLQHAINTARGSLLREVVVVTDTDLSGRPDLDLSGCRVAVDPAAARGQAEALNIGLRAADGADGCMVLMADQPLLRTATIDHLIWAFSQHPDFWIVPVIEDMQGDPVTVPAAWLPRLRELEGDAPARTLLSARGLSLRLVKIDHPGPFIDIDTEGQYRLLLRRHEARGNRRAA